MDARKDSSQQSIKTICQLTRPQSLPRRKQPGNKDSMETKFNGKG